MSTNGYVTVLPHTVADCRKGCDVKTVQVNRGYGDLVRVHCGTYRHECPPDSGKRRS